MGSSAASGVMLSGMNATLQADTTASEMQSVFQADESAKQAGQMAQVQGETGRSSAALQQFSSIAKKFNDDGGQLSV